MSAGQTPLRDEGLRTAEGWILLRDAGSTYDDGVEDALYEIFESEADLRSVNSALMSRAHGRAEAFQLDPARANIVRGLAIAPDAHVLEIGAGCGAITRYLGERAALVDAIEPAPARARVARARTRDLPGVEVFVGEHSDVPAVPTYDVVVVVGVLEYVGGGSSEPDAYVEFLSHLARCLKPGGTIALAIENKLGVKYLVGAPEDHTDKVFDSIETYPGGAHAHTFSRRELEGLFVAAGLLPQVRIAFPDYKLTRTVMDADALMVDAPGLLYNLPSFPSADLRSPRPKLADERRVWRSLVDAGLAADTGNSFLVLAGKGAEQALWPDDLDAVYYSRSRRENYSFEKRVLRESGGLVIDRRRVGRADPDATVDFTEGREDVVDGLTLQEAADHLSIAEAAALLVRWRDELATRFAGSDDVPFDYVPNNLVLCPDGSIEPIDQEWTVRGWSVDRVIRRGVLWFVAQLVQSSTPARWRGFSSVREIAVAFGAAVGLDEAGDWIPVAVTEESEFLAEVGIRGFDDSAEDRVAVLERALTSMIDDCLTDLALGDRLPDTLVKVQRYLQTSEESVAHLISQIEPVRAEAAAAAAAEADARAARAAAEAEASASKAAEAEARRAQRAAAADVQAAENMQAMLQQRLVMAEAGRAAENGRADVAEAALAGLRGSRTFRVVRLYARVVDRLAPVGTRRRRAHGAAIRFAIRTARRARPLPITAPVPVRVPLSDEPFVSIVIPVYGKWEYTERCLRAVAETSGGLPYEVIVVDDKSPDDSLAQLRAVVGVRVVALEENLGFVGACNAGIAAARGEYVVLLNNDTRVQPDWLTPLVETISEPGIGLVGSRLQYPDGRLQEAGGIVFSDGSGWNYGKFEDPENSAYTYRRDVDYCSGASIILRKSTLDALGNLDTRFSPAYYDDTDLAFGVRALGLRVVYEPRSVVIHDEGVSHGTDETTGVKAYQAVNKEKFVAKWRTQLDQQCAPGAVNVPFAARRRNGERIVVVIDHYVPRPDEDAGSVRMMAILSTLRQLGYGVLFVPDNRFRTEPWTTKLGTLGIEVFYGHGDLPARLRQLAEHIDAVIVSRVTVAWSHVFTIRTVLPDAPLIFDTVDLHFLREERASELAGELSLSPRAKTLKSLELAIAESSDATIVVSTFEKDYLGSIVDANVQILPTVHEPVGFAPAVDARSGLLFVGSFVHHPNADGLRWFVEEILPIVETSIPGVAVTIVGKNPDPLLVAAAPANVRFLGWVEDLEPLYAEARVALAPLRYGAGVKGKIGEAMAHGVPVVMTPVGAEGMDIRHGETAWVATDAASFADGVVALLSDDVMWSDMSRAAAQHIDAHFGPTRFSARLAEILEGVRGGRQADMQASASTIVS